MDYQPTAYREQIPLSSHINLAQANLQPVTKSLRDELAMQLLGPPSPSTNSDVARQTRIICTIGPKCNSPEILSEMIQAGMDVARLNFSHIKSYDEAKQLVDNLQKAMELARRKIEILADLPGPKIRIGAQAEPFEVKVGETLDLGPSGHLPLNPGYILHDLAVGQRVLVEDGRITLRIKSCNADKVIAEVEDGGILKPGKGVNLPDTQLKERVPTVRDIEKLAIIKQLGITRVAASFVETAQDIENVRSAYKAVPGPEPTEPLQVIAKIERPLAVKNLEELFRASDGHMVARGDLAVEVGDEQIPLIQHRIHQMAVKLQKPSGTATQMLASMQSGDRPLRAEVADVAMSVLQHANFVMTSEETAMGEDPVNVVRWMDKIVRAVEGDAEEMSLGQ